MATRSADPVRICFPFIAQIHQTFHSLSIAGELARRHRVEVHLACATLAHLDFVRALVLSYYPDADVIFDLLVLPAFIRAAIPLLGQGIAPKLLALFCNIRYFSGFQAIVVPERTTLLLRPFLRRTKIIWTRHGAGDRASGFQKEIAKFDFVVMAGEKIERRLLDEGLIREGHYVTGIYAKFDLVDRMPRKRLFDNNRRTVVYNPHFWLSLSSWPLVGRQVLDFFATSDRYNLVFAPHIRLFYPPRPRKYEAFRDYAALPHMKIDLGSDACADMTYTRSADLYLGDVSSQVAEFVRDPRPCVFLNPRRTAWQGDVNYRFWELGPVVDDISRLGDALDEAFERFGDYRAKQIDYAAETFGAARGPTAPVAADAIVHFLESS